MPWESESKKKHGRTHMLVSAIAYGKWIGALFLPLGFSYARCATGRLTYPPGERSRPPLWGWNSHIHQHVRRISVLAHRAGGPVSVWVWRIRACVHQVLLERSGLQLHLLA